MALWVRNLKRFIFAGLFSFVLLATIHRPTQETVSWAIHESESYIPNSLKEQLLASAGGDKAQTVFQKPMAQSPQDKPDETYNRYSGPDTGKARLEANPFTGPSEQISGNRQDPSTPPAPGEIPGSFVPELDVPWSSPGSSPQNNQNPKSPESFPETNPQLGKWASSAQSNKNPDRTNPNLVAKPNAVFQQVEN